jgi:hypothetical protein
MDKLKTPNNLLYFTNNELQITLGLSIDKSLKPIMWYRERDDIITRSKFVNKNVDIFFPEYTDIDKLVIKFSEHDSPCMCSSITNTYISIITLNYNNEHRATYKLHLYYKNGNTYDDIGLYYSYFA